MDELRCENKMHGIVISRDILEVVCTSRFCGAGNGVVVLHRFSLETAKLLQTMKFANPRKEKA